MDPPSVPRTATLVRLTLSLGVIGLVLTLVDWRASLLLLAGVSLGWVAVAYLVNAAALLLSARRWQQLLTLLAPGLRFADALRFYWAGAFFSSVLPSSVGGDVARLALARRAGGTPAVAASMLVERASGLGVVLVLAAISLLSSPEIIAGGRAISAGALGAALGVLALVLLLALAGWRRLSTLRPYLALLATPPVKRLAAQTATFSAALRQYRQHPGALLLTCLLSAGFYLLLALFQFAVIRAVGGQIGFGSVLVITPCISLVMGLPVAINGIGVSEGVFVFLYGQAGLSHELALAAALLRRLVITGVALVGAALWLTIRRDGGPAPSE